MRTKIYPTRGSRNVENKRARRLRCVTCKKLYKRNKRIDTINDTGEVESYCKKHYYKAVGVNPKCYT